MKYPYTINILAGLLHKEEANLLMWQKTVADNRDVFAVRQANGNMPSTQHRIDELKKAIECLSQNS